MCNACGFLCCGSDQLGECGCDGCTVRDCWDRCEWCGDTTQFGSCLCDEDDEYADA